MTNWRETPIQERCAPRSEEESFPGLSLARWRRNRFWRVVSAFVGIVAVGLSTYYIVVKLSSSIRQVADWQLSVRPWPALLSFVIMLLCVLSGCTIWHLVLKGVGRTLPWRVCARAHLLANLGGYLPGYGWKFVGKAYLIQREGVAMGMVSFAVLLEFMGLATTRAVVALATLPRSFLDRFGWDLPDPYFGWLRIGACCLLFSLPWLVERTVLWMQHHSRRRWGDLLIDKRALWLALLLMCFTWVLYGLGFALLIRSLYDVRLDQVSTLVFSTTTSFLVSLMMFFIPGGISVREGVVIYTLENVLPDVIVTVGALLSRLVLLLAEAIGALVGSWMSYRRRLCK